MRKKKGRNRYVFLRTVWMGRMGVLVDISGHHDGGDDPDLFFHYEKNTRERRLHDGQANDPG
jgi:hypothetical protein